MLDYENTYQRKIIVTQLRNFRRKKEIQKRNGHTNKYARLLLASTFISPLLVHWQRHYQQTAEISIFYTSIFRVQDVFHCLKLLIFLIPSKHTLGRNEQNAVSDGEIYSPTHLTPETCNKITQ